MSEKAKLLTFEEFRACDASQPLATAVRQQLAFFTNHDALPPGELGLDGWAVWDGAAEHAAVEA